MMSGGPGSDVGTPHQPRDDELVDEQEKERGGIRACNIASMPQRSSNFQQIVLDDETVASAIICRSLALRLDSLARSSKEFRPRVKFYEPERVAVLSVPN
jgi:hypothetical protein